MKRAVEMIVILFLFWLILSQQITLEICIFGLLITGCIAVFMCRHLGYNLKTEWKIWKCAVLGCAYLLVLILEILKANWAVAGIILGYKKHYHPAIVCVNVPLQHPVLQAIYANSITITPGTITVEQECSTYTIHCLDENMAQGITDSTLVKILQKMEGTKA